MKKDDTILARLVTLIKETMDQGDRSRVMAVVGNSILVGVSRPKRGPAIFLIKVEEIG